MKKILLLILLTNFLYGCSSVTDGFKLKKKDNADEFLVEKKNPQILPPNYNELPTHKSENTKQEKTPSFNINLKTETSSKSKNILKEESSST